ncbi:unnamed protein product, partial [marine sediment metagenome]
MTPDEHPNVELFLKPIRAGLQDDILNAERDGDTPPTNAAVAVCLQIAKTIA